MKNFLCVFTAFFALQTNVEAALPPLWQGKAEILAILEDPEFGKAFESGDMIYEIKKTEQGWQIITNRNAINIHLEYLKQEMPGPAKFKITFDK